MDQLVGVPAPAKYEVVQSTLLHPKLVLHKLVPTAAAM